MSIITLSPTDFGKLRPLNILRDLPKVADLVELCFHKNMDNEGKSYVQQMRTASQDRRYLNWASNSLPFKGYIWEDEKRVVGNISIIPFRKAKKNVILLANIAVHPDYRRRGIARELTQKGIKDAQKRGAASIWLHVERNNLGAINLYKELGFEAHSLRTTWIVKSEHPPKKTSIKSVSGVVRFWEKENRWLNRAYPKEIRWYRMPDLRNFKPGIRHWLYRLFVEYDLRQWTIQKDGERQAALFWMRTYTRRAPIWLAASPQADSESLTNLLLYARLKLAAPRRIITLDYPADQFTSAFENAGFTFRRTLLWMRKS